MAEGPNPGQAPAQSEFRNRSWSSKSSIILEFTVNHDVNDCVSCNARISSYRFCGQRKALALNTEAVYSKHFNK